MRNVMVGRIFSALIIGLCSAVHCVLVHDPRLWGGYSSIVEDWKPFTPERRYENVGYLVESPKNAYFEGLNYHHHQHRHASQPLKKSFQTSPRLELQTSANAYVPQNAFQNLGLSAYGKQKPYEYQQKYVLPEVQPYASYHSFRDPGGNLDYPKSNNYQQNYYQQYQPHKEPAASIFQQFTPPPPNKGSNVQIFPPNGRNPFYNTYKDQQQTHFPQSYTNPTFRTTTTEAADYPKYSSSYSGGNGNGNGDGVGSGRKENAGAQVFQQLSHYGRPFSMPPPPPPEGQTFKEYHGNIRQELANAPPQYVPGKNFNGRVPAGSISQFDVPIHVDVNTKYAESPFKSYAAAVQVPKSPPRQYHYPQTTATREQEEETTQYRYVPRQKSTKKPFLPTVTDDEEGLENYPPSFFRTSRPTTTENYPETLRTTENYPLPFRTTTVVENYPVVVETTTTATENYPPPFQTTPRPTPWSFTGNDVEDKVEPSTTTELVETTTRRRRRKPTKSPLRRRPETTSTEATTRWRRPTTAAAVEDEEMTERRRRPESTSTWKPDEEEEVPNYPATREPLKILPRKRTSTTENADITSTTTTETTTYSYKSRVKGKFNSTRPKFSIKDYKKTTERTETTATTAITATTTAATITTGEVVAEHSINAERNKSREDGVFIRKFKPRLRLPTKVKTSATSTAATTAAETERTTFKPSSRYASSKYRSRTTTEEPDAEAAPSVRQPVRTNGLFSAKRTSILRKETTTKAADKADNAEETDIMTSSEEMAEVKKLKEEREETEETVKEETTVAPVKEHSTVVLPATDVSWNMEEYIKSNVDNKDYAPTAMAADQPLLPIEAFFKNLYQERNY